MRMLTDFFLFSGMDNEVNKSFSLRKKLGRNKKSALAFALLIVFTCAMFGLSRAFFGNSFLLKLIMFTSLGILGYLHTRVLEGSLSVLTPKEQLMYSLLLTLTVTVVLCLFYFFSGRFDWLTISAGGAAFLVPYVVMELWRLYQSASVGAAALWYYGDGVVQGTSTVFLNSIPIQVKIQTETHGRVEQVVSFRAPVRMKLGLIFYHIVKEQNANRRLPIELFDASTEPYGWAFFKETLMGWSQFLDPEATLVQNGIKPNQKIIARRVNKQNLLTYQQKQYLN